MDHTKLRESISQNFTAAAMQSIYNLFVTDWIKRKLFPQTGITAKTLKKKDYVDIFFTLYSDKEIFSRCYATLPDTIKEIFSRITWDGFCDITDFERDYGVKILLSTPWGGDKQVVKDYHFFNCFSYQRWSFSRGGILTLPRVIISQLRAYLPPPPAYKFIPQDEADVNACFAVHHSEEEFITGYELYQEYISAGNLTRTTTGKISTSSLKKMQEYCGIGEFYTEGKEERLIKTTFLAELFSHPELILSGKQSLASYKQAILFVKKVLHVMRSSSSPDNNYFFFQLLVGHIKTGYSSPEYPWQALVALLKEIPRKKWFSIDDIEKYALYHNFVLEMFEQYELDQYVKINFDNECVGGEYRTPTLKFERAAIRLPMLKAFFFMMAALGCVEVAYDKPVNSTVWLANLPYCTVFDGLRYVRLTALGEHILGDTKKYKATITERSGRVVLDDSRLLIMLEGNDRVQRLAVEKIAEHITGNHYRVTPQSFFKDCTSRKDIRDSIDYFTNKIGEPLPKNWKLFFDEVLQRINPLTPISNMLVFSFDPSNKQLLNLLLHDPELRSLVSKAEGHRFLVSRANYPKLRKRLEEKGFFTEQEERVSVSPQQKTSSRKTLAWRL